MTLFSQALIQPLDNLSAQVLCPHSQINHENLHSHHVHLFQAETASEEFFWNQTPERCLTPLEKRGIVKNGSILNIYMTTPRRLLATGTESMLSLVVTCVKWCHCQRVSCSGFRNSSQSPYETSLSLFLFLGPVWILNSKQSLWLFSFLNLDLCITTWSVSPRFISVGPISQHGFSVRSGEH